MRGCAVHGGMVRSRKQAPLPFEYVPEPDGDEVTAWSGLPMLVETMRPMGVDEVARKLAIRQRDAGHDEFELLSAFVLLLAAGGDCLDDLRMLREDKALCTLHGHGLPSPDVLRRTLELCHDEDAVTSRAGLEPAEHGGTLERADAPKKPV